jgi:hypothetical protein
MAWPVGHAAGFAGPFPAILGTARNRGRLTEAELEPEKGNDE